MVRLAGRLDDHSAETRVMIWLRRIPGFLLAAAFLAGLLTDGPAPNPPMTLGGYRVLTADFHIHTHPFSAGTLAPWDVVWEASRQGLDVIAITPHCDTLGAKIGQWFSKVAGGPLVIVGEEIHAPTYHVIAVGIHETISWRLPAAQAITEVHEQGGVAIAAHPIHSAWPAFDEAAMSQLDATEVAQPVIYSDPRGRSDLRRFYRRKPLTAIGSSDYHGQGPVGLFRTFVFVHEVTEAGILEALRNRRTVVYNEGEAFGDPDLIQLAAQDGRLPKRASPPDVSGGMAVCSRIAGWLGMVGLIVFTGRARRSS